MDEREDDAETVLEPLMDVVHLCSAGAGGEMYC